MGRNKVGCSVGCIGTVIGIAYLVGCFMYGPWDTIKVGASMVVPSVKQADYDHARRLYGKRIRKTELSKGDMAKFHSELEAIVEEGNPVTVNDISYGKLLDWIEDND